MRKAMSLSFSFRGYFSFCAILLFKKSIGAVVYMLFVGSIVSVFVVHSCITNMLYFVFLNACGFFLIAWVRFMQHFKFGNTWTNKMRSVRGQTSLERSAFSLPPHMNEPILTVAAERTSRVSFL
jgi:protein-S-isoprenylcysteine O-methyltransferase Ste14